MGHILANELLRIIIEEKINDDKRAVTKTSYVLKIISKCEIDKLQKVEETSGRQRRVVAAPAFFSKAGQLRTNIY